MIWPTWFEHLEESYSYKEDQLKKFCLPVKTSCPPAENVNETPAVPFKKSIVSKPYHSVHSERAFAYPWVIQWLNEMDYNETIYFKTREQCGLQSLMNAAQILPPCRLSE